MAGAPGGPPDAISSFLEPLTADFDGFSFGEDTLWGQERRTGAFNWKLGVEAFLEVYHFRSLHPAMKNYVFVPEVALFDRLGEHVRIVAPKRQIRELRDVPPQEWELRPYATIVYFVFPSTFVFVEKRHLSTLQIRPRSAGTSEVRILHVARPDGLLRPDGLRRNIGLFMQAVGEDIGAAESIHSGLSGLPQDLIFGRNEAGLHYFRQALERSLAGEPVPAGRKP